MNKRKTEVYMMVGALLLLFVGLPVALWGANAFNGYLSGVSTFSQVENVTAFYNGPILDGDDEYKVASYNGTTVVEETPSWDSNEEWDSIILLGNGTNNKVVFNWNVTVDDLLASKYNGFRMKFNGTDHLIVTVNAVKWDGVTLTSVQAYENLHVLNESATITWNMTPMNILNLKTTLAPAGTDEVYFQIIVTGYDSDNYLVLADTFEFQFATSEPGNVYAFTHLQILQGSATILGLTFILVGFASTSAWNPFGGGNAPVNRAYRAGKRTVSKTNKKRRK